MTVSPMAIATRSRLTDRAHHVVLHDRRVDGGGALKVVLEEPQHVRLYSGGGGGTMSGGRGGTSLKMEAPWQAACVSALHAGLSRLHLAAV